MKRSRFAPKALLFVAMAMLVSACGGGGGGGGTPPTATPTATPVVSPSPTASPTSAPNPSAYICPTSGVAAPQMLGTAQNERHAFTRPSGAVSQAIPGLYEVEYATGSASMLHPMLAAKVASFRGSTMRSFENPMTGRTVQFVHVDPQQAQSAVAALQALPGVVRVVPSGRAHLMATNARDLTSEPMFGGEPATQGGTSGGGINDPPLYQTSTTGGQWDMHMIGLDYAFDYSQANNGSGIVNVNALGSPSVKVAVIDTGEDLSLRELQGANGTPKTVYAKCFLTNLAGTAQTTSKFVTDYDGHGTDTSSIVAADSDNGYAFVAAGGNVSLMAYRIFPTPDDTCVPGGTSDNQCGAAYQDIASAIDDAVNNGANVISMSIGGGTCTNGKDPDPSEGAAIANAIAHNVVVVAAAGNESASTIDAPACDTGVIAVGASALDDGQPDGSGHTGGTATAPIEYVASYSNYAAAAPSTWGIVAPGGDASAIDQSGSTTDLLHWIENAWTSTPLDANFAGNCATDIFGETGNCRVLIEGTSMATPHVAGAAALILSVAPGYDTPGAMEKLLCSTADNINAPHQGCGRLDVNRAMAQALGDPVPPGPVTP
ncbi:MAG: S8 family peptidase [Vulcanimicrobiaceae bacterium]